MGKRVVGLWVLWKTWRGWGAVAARRAVMHSLGVTRTKDAQQDTQGTAWAACGLARFGADFHSAYGCYGLYTSLEKK